MFFKLIFCTLKSLASSYRRIYSFLNKCILEKLFRASRQTKNQKNKNAIKELSANRAKEWVRVRCIDKKGKTGFDLVFLAIWNEIKSWIYCLIKCLLMALQPRRGSLISEIESKLNKLQHSSRLHGALSQNHSSRNHKRSRPEIGLITTQYRRLLLSQKFSPIIAWLANSLRSRYDFKGHFATLTDYWNWPCN